jgi:5-dehydro-2-deoxygluconokinase
MGRVAIDFNPIDYFKTLAESDTFKKYVGGSPANIAVGLARLGKKVGFIGKVSDDRFGDYVTEFFKKEGIDVSHISRAANGEKLGLTFTEILSQTESCILMYRDGIADLMLHPNDVDESYIACAKAILISGTALSQSPSREACLKAMYLAKKTDTKIIFDIDYRPYNWKNEDEKAIYYSIVAENSDMIMGSREEFDLMESITEKGRDDKASAKYWMAKGNKIIIIKHGKQGSTAYTADGEFSIKPFPVVALKSFGGGDGYGSAFIYGLLEGWDIMECLELGSASASMLVAAHGCSLFMPTIDEVKKFIAESKSKYGDMVARG